MSTTSNSRAENPRGGRRRPALAVALSAFGLLGLPAALASAGPPDAPLPAEPKSEAKKDAPAPAQADDTRPHSARPVALKTVTVRKLNLQADRAAADLAGPRFLEAAADPVRIEVNLAEPVDDKPRTSWPVILLNGKVIKNTRVSGEARDKLVGFLPDRKALLERNTIEVVWVGNERLSKTRQPLTFSAKDVKE